MQLHNLQRSTPYKRSKRVGRGGSRGKTSGRGTKGQKARAGHKILPAIREILKKLPKKRGYRSPSLQEKRPVVNVGVLSRVFVSGSAVTPKILLERGVLTFRRGQVPRVKILGDGALDKKLNVSGCEVSASARSKIEAAGGVVE